MGLFQAGATTFLYLFTTDIQTPAVNTRCNYWVTIISRLFPTMRKRPSKLVSLPNRDSSFETTEFDYLLVRYVAAVSRQFMPQPTLINGKVFGHGVIKLPNVE